MKVFPLVCATIVLCASTSALAKTSDNCYVSGDTSKSKAHHTYGSKQNPYSSLAEVQADLDCVAITVLYSDTPLDGGIALRDGQSLEGKRGKKGAFPVITNSSAVLNGGTGVLLALNNELKKLHIANTWTSGVMGSFPVQPFGGTQFIQNLTVSGANQSGGFNAFGSSNSSIAMGVMEGLSLVIEDSDIGQAETGSIGIAQFNGFADIRITNTIVRDQGHDPDAANSPGIAVLALNAASIDLAIVGTTVTNIGEGESNSDGLLLLNQGWGTMSVLVDGYHFTNPDSGGGSSATGIEMGFYGSVGGGTFNGEVINSTIDGSNSSGIQVLDQASENGHNFLTVNLRDNKISNCSTGLSLGGQYWAPYSSYSVEVSGNTILNSAYIGIAHGAGWGALASQHVKLEENTISNSGQVGVYFQLFNGTIDSSQLDAGLGGLGSAGLNRITGSGLADIVVDGDLDVSAANNWWGSDAGPAVVEELNGGTVDVDPFLTKDPKPGKRKGQR